jgi:predicted dehydrogenase
MDVACETMNLAMVGCGGYAGYLMNRIADLPDLCRLAAVTTRRPDSKAARKLKEQGVAVLKDLDELLEKITPDECPVIIIPTSIESHYEYTRKTVEAGFHVLLEKPPVATIQDLDRLIQLQRNSDKWIAVNFQHLFNPMTQRLKNRLAAGDFGSVKSVRARALWMRPEAYFSRSSWSGKMKVDGQWVLDGTIGNPLAHLLAEALYLAMPEPGMATPIRVQAELYRGNEIESEDTSCLRIETEGGVPVFYCASLCSKDMTPVFCEIETEKADICLTDYFRLSIQWKDGRIEEMETPNNDADLDRLIMLRLIIDDLVKGNRPLITVEECRPYVLAWNGAFESFGVPAAVPESAVSAEINETGPVRCIPGFFQMAEQACRDMKLFSELGVEWARSGDPVDVTDYKTFPSRNDSLNQQKM